MSITINKVRIENPYAIVLLPNYNIVRIGEKNDIEIEYDKIINKIKNFDGNINSITKQAIMMLCNAGFDVQEPTKEDVIDLLNDYMLLELPKNEEEIKRMLNTTGYLKSLIKQEV